MNKTKRIQLDRSKLVGVRAVKGDLRKGKLSLAQAMVGDAKVCVVAQ